MTTSTSDSSRASILSQIVELRNAWEQDYPERAQGGLLALSGFEYQFLMTLLKIVHLWKESTETERQDLETAKKVLSEAISDITEIGIDITCTQAKRTLSVNGVRKALEELWEIYNLASEKTPALVKHIQFVISGQFKGDENPQQIIQGWGTRTKAYPPQQLILFKERVRYEIVLDPRSDLLTELKTLALDEDIDSIIARWLGYLLQLGSGFSPESISAFIWKELINDGSLVAFRATLARLFSRSQYHLSSIRETLGEHITLPRAQLAELYTSLHKKKITLLMGQSGSGKSALCKLGIQQSFNQEFDCLFLHASDIASFTESSDVIANRGLRRLDEFLIAQITQKPNLIVIDDLSDVNEQHLDAVLDLLQNTLNVGTSANVSFILVLHVDAKRRIQDKIAARLGNNYMCGNVNLPQLPIEEIKSSKDLPSSIVSLVDRHHEFGPALNLKLIDWLVRSTQRDEVDISAFKNDLDLLTWFWYSHVQDGQYLSDLGQALTKIAEELANRFTPDLPYYFDPSIENRALCTLVKRDCLRIVDEKIATTHRFVGDCARFHILLANRRTVDHKYIVARVKNPFWIQPVRWFAMHLINESTDDGAWQELFHDALENEDSQLLLDLLIDSSILSKKADIVLQECPKEKIASITTRLVARFFAVATVPYLDFRNDTHSIPLQTLVALQEQMLGLPKVDLWLPAWQWFLSQEDPVMTVEDTCIIFRAAEAWLNWSNFAENLPLRPEIAEFTLSLLSRILLPDPDLTRRRVTNSELKELFKPREQDIIPKSKHVRSKFIYLDKYEANAFACIVFALRIIPEHSAWLLRALVGREIVPANKLEPTQVSNLITRPGVGKLSSPHPQGPFAIVNHQFRTFLLSRGGSYLNYIVRTDIQLGIEILFALTIEAPDYVYECDYSDHLGKKFGTEGSQDIDICTYKYLPLISLLETNEELGIQVITTLSRVATNSWHKNERKKNNNTVDNSLEGNSASMLEGNSASMLNVAINTDTDTITLLIDDERKHFQGGRQSLYWHRNHTFCPDIVACFLMTLEGWLYSRPSRMKLETSISLVFKYADTVAVIGVLISLAKCYPPLLSNFLLPISSSLQLLIWIECEQRDFALGSPLNALFSALRISEEVRNDLLEFHNLEHRRVVLGEHILLAWLEKNISEEKQLNILNDWDEKQLQLIPEASKYRARVIRTLFNSENWEKTVNNGKSQFLFDDNKLPADPEVALKADAANRKLEGRRILFECQEILKGNRHKTQEFHNYLLSLLVEDEKFNSLTEGFDKDQSSNILWASIAVTLKPPFNAFEESIERAFRELSEALLNLDISFEKSCRCQFFDLDAHAFIADVSPKLISWVPSDTEMRIGAFRCLIGIRNLNTSTFVKSWLQEYGIQNLILQDLIKTVPLIARLLSLTHKYYEATYIQNNSSDDGLYRYPHPEEIDDEIRKSEDVLIDEVWLDLEESFSENQIIDLSILEASKWIPEKLKQIIQNFPDWIRQRFFQNSIDWEFLSSAIIPIFKMETINSQELINSLHEQLISLLVNKRNYIYGQFEARHENNKLGFDQRSLSQLSIDQDESRILDAIIRLESRNLLHKVNIAITTLISFNLLDCILLKHILQTLSFDFEYNKCNNFEDLNDHELKASIAFLIGTYLAEYSKQDDSLKKILGDVSEVWIYLIELLAQKPTEISSADQNLLSFFEEFQLHLYNYGGRSNLYKIAKVTGFRKFRRRIFEAVISHKELLPDSRNAESEMLVQLIFELWNSDREWILRRQSMCQELGRLLGYLQEIDAVGARYLSDQITHLISSP